VLLFCFRFAPRIHDLNDKNLYVHGDIKAFPTLASLIGVGINVKHIRTQWDDVLRKAADWLQNVELAPGTGWPEQK